MKNNEMLKILAAMFALRARYYSKKWNTEHNNAFLGNCVSYENAFDMLAYAVHAANDEGWGYDCLCQFDWFSEAEAIIDKLGADVGFWDLQEFIQKGLDKPTEV